MLSIIMLTLATYAECLHHFCEQFMLITFNSISSLIAMAVFSKLVRSINKHGKTKKPQTISQSCKVCSLMLNGLKIKGKVQYKIIAWLIYYYYSIASAPLGSYPRQSTSHGSVQSRRLWEEKGKICGYFEIFSKLCVSHHQEPGICQGIFLAM